MKSRIYATTFALGLTAFAAAPLWAQNNPEDDNIPDENVPAVSTPTLVAPADNNTTSTPPGTPADGTSGSEIGAGSPPEDQMLGDNDVPTNTAPDNSSTGNVAAASGETVTIPRAVWEQLQRDVADLKASRAAGNSPQNVATTSGGESSTGNADAANAAATSGASPGTEETAAPAPRNYLSLPDISFILQAKGLLGNDRRDEGRTRFNLSEGELGIQGYVYPGVKADAFIVGAPAEDEPFQVEEGYLTFLGVKKGLNINVGRKFAPFGRTGELHNHSWLYPRQLLPIRNLVSEEALVGDGVNFNYLFPTKGSLFVRGSLGFFSGEGTSSQFNLGNPNDPFFGGVPSGTGAGFTRRFINARLWAGHPIGENGELEIGVSRAHGTSEIGDDVGNNFSGNVTISGADISYRRFMNGGKRLLLRSEYFLYQPKGGLPTRRASGYYGLANMRLNPYNDVGLLYERSGFPQFGGHETALSLIYTKQFTEQFYARVMGTHGNRPGGSYNEIRLQFTAGLGPHTHALE